MMDRDFIKASIFVSGAYRKCLIVKMYYAIKGGGVAGSFDESNPEVFSQRLHILSPYFGQFGIEDATTECATLVNETRSCIYLVRGPALTKRYSANYRLPRKRALCR